MHFNYLGLLIAVPFTFVISAIWNSPPVFGKLRVSLLHGDAAVKAEQRPSPATIAGELIRCALLSVTICVFSVWLRIDDIGGALGFASLAWFGFQAVLLFGGVVWESMPVKLYAIHVGDALIRMVIISVIVTLV